MTRHPASPSAPKTAKGFSSGSARDRRRSGRRPLRALPLIAAGALVAPLALTVPASADPSYVPLPQSAMSVVEADSAEEGSPAQNVLDGDTSTIWHTAWKDEVDELPHQLSVQVSETPVEVARVRLDPRKDSNGSGRIGDYEVHTSTDPECAENAYTLAAEGSFDGSLADATTERTITLDSPVEASCVKVVWLSSWGGKASDPETSPPEQVASLAELNVDVIGDEADPDPIVVDPPEGTATISDGDVSVRLHPDFPQVVDYSVDGSSLAGRYGAAHTAVVIDDVSYDVEVTAPELSEDGASATYHLTVPELEGTSFDAVLSVKEGVFTWKLTHFVDPSDAIHRISVPRLDLASANGTESGAQVVGADLSVDRDRSGDHFYDLASLEDGTSLTDPSHVALLHNDQLAAGFETNAVEDNTAGGETAERVQNDNSRYIVSLAQGDGASYGTVSPGTFVVRGSTADQGIGADADPFVRVRLAVDANDDGAVDWQDAAIAARDIEEEVTGGDAVKNEVIKRIPFNIVSQATHPFLRTLDDTKRVSLATEGLGQSVMLKGYQAEGHDSAHPDYAGHYNEAAGGLDGSRDPCRRRGGLERHVRRARQRHRVLLRGARLLRGPAAAAAEARLGLDEPVLCDRRPEGPRHRERARALPGLPGRSSREPVLPVHGRLLPQRLGGPTPRPGAAGAGLGGLHRVGRQDAAGLDLVALGERRELRRLHQQGRELPGDPVPRQ